MRSGSLPLIRTCALANCSTVFRTYPSQDKRYCCIEHKNLALKQEPSNLKCLAQTRAEGNCVEAAYGFTGLCNAHYLRLRKTGTLEPSRQAQRRAGRLPPPRCVDCGRLRAIHGEASYKPGRCRDCHNAHKSANSLRKQVCKAVDDQGPCHKRATGIGGYCPMHTRRLQRYGSVSARGKNPHLRPGEPPSFSRQQNNTGYVFWMAMVPAHARQPDRTKQITIPEQVLVLEKHLGRPIDTSVWDVHHKNGVRHDNRAENLELRPKHHGRGQSLKDKVKYAREILHMAALLGMDL